MFEFLRNEKVNDTFNLLKRVFLCFFTVYLILREITPLKFIAEYTIITFCFYLVAALFIAVDFFNNRFCFKTKHLILPVIFLVITGISSVLNYNYDLFSNVKGIAAFVIYIFLIYPEAFKDDKKRTIYSCFNTAFYTLGFFSFFSIPMYFLDVTYLLADGSDIGFSTLYNRLWGLFFDPNYASMFLLIAIMSSLLLFKRAKSVFLKVLIIIIDFFNLIYICSSGSRMAIVSMIFILVWFSLIIVVKKLNIKIIYRLFTFVLATVISVLIPIGLDNFVSSGMPLVKKELLSVTSKKDYVNIHKAYDSLYQFGRVEIVGGFLTEEKMEEIENSQTQEEVEVEKLDRTDKKDDVSNGRIDRWKNGLKIFAKTPFVGTSPRGIHSFARENAPDTSMAQAGYNVHNTYLEVLVGTGMFGFIAIFTFLLLAASFVIKTALCENVTLETIVFSTIVALIAIAGFFLSDLFLFQTSFSALFFWLCVGYCLNKNSEDFKESFTYRLIKGKKEA